MAPPVRHRSRTVRSNSSDPLPLHPGGPMSETWRRRILYVAGAWNVVGGVSALADPARHFAQLYGAALTLDDPLQAFFYILWLQGPSPPAGC